MASTNAAPSPSAGSGSGSGSGSNSDTSSMRVIMTTTDADDGAETIEHQPGRSSASWSSSPTAASKPYLAALTVSDGKSFTIWPRARESTASSPIPSAVANLQYGIEIETTLAFHESLLPAYLQPRESNIGDDGNDDDNNNIDDDEDNDDDEPEDKDTPAISLFRDPYRRRLVKQLSRVQAIALSNAAGTDASTRSTRPPGYQSWAIKSTGAELSDWEMKFFNRHGRRVDHHLEADEDADDGTECKRKFEKDRMLRTYWTEPLKIVEEVFRKRKEEQGRADIPMIKPNFGKENTDGYGNWAVVNDQTLVGAPRELLKQILMREGPVNDEEEVEEWDSSGIEIVSPVFDAEHAKGLEEIERVMDVLAGKHEGQRHFAFENPFAAIHVHVGFNSYLNFYLDQWREQDPDFATKQAITQAPPNLMPVLQHFVWIWLMYEHIIVTLFPKHRRGIPGTLSAGDIKSNRAHFLNTVRAQHTTLNDDDNDNAGKSALALTVSQIHSTIFHTPSQTVTSIRNLMQADKSRAYMLSLDPIAKACSSLGWHAWDVRTAEFRLHESTTDAREIEMYVGLCVAIVRAAERLASKQGQNEQGGNVALEGEGVFEKEVEAKLGLEDFLTVLDLAEREKVYWRERCRWFEGRELDGGQEWFKSWDEAERGYVDEEEVELELEEAEAYEAEEDETLSMTESEMDRFEAELRAEMEGTTG